MLMVYLIGLGTALSLYFIYKNKTKISFELLKYYTSWDEYLAKFSKSRDTSFLYPNTFGDLNETNNIKTLLINLNEYNFNYLITKDYLVHEAETEGEETIGKTFYTIYNILKNDNSNDKIPNQDENKFTEVIKQLPSINNNGIISTIYEENLDEIFFNNKMELLNTIKWNSSIIAASITILDTNKVFTHRDLDITGFITSLVRKNTILKVNNSVEQKHLWLHLVNYLFKDSNITIPIEDSIINSIKLKWIIILDNFEVMEGGELDFIIS